MEIAVLGSGSAPNATLVRARGVTILLEAGLSARQIAERARAAGYDPGAVAAAFVSHAHTDHVQGAPVFSRRHRVPVFMTDPTRETLRRLWRKPPSFHGSETLAEGDPAILRLVLLERCDIDVAAERLHISKSDAAERFERALQIARRLVRTAESTSVG